MLTVGSLLAGRYAVERVLGRGGMGSVYLGRCQENAVVPKGTFVAIKEVLSNQPDEEERTRSLAIFRQEVGILTSLGHPGLVPVHESFEAFDNQYLVMAFIDGWSMAQVIKRLRQPLPPSRVQDFADQLCDVLDYLHTRTPPVIFRDLKPSNVMVDRRGRLRLIDFGIARLFQDESVTSTFIRGVGSAGYAPLEQYGAGGTDPRSDVYALGATLYTLLTRQIPPPSASIVAGAAILKSIRSLNPDVPAHWERAISKMMGLRKEDRFASVREAQKAFQEAPDLSQDPVTGRLLSTDLKAISLGDCLIWKQTGNVPYPVEAGSTPLVLAGEGLLPVGLVIGLTREGTGGVTIRVGDADMAARAVDLGFPNAVAHIVAEDARSVPPPARLAPILKDEFRELALQLSQRLDDLPPARQLAALPTLERLLELAHAGHQERLLTQVVQLQERTGSARLTATRLKLGERLLGNGKREAAQKCFAEAVRSVREEAQAAAEQKQWTTALELHQKVLSVYARGSKQALVTYLDEIAPSLRAHLGQAWVQEEIRWREQAPGVHPAGLAQARLQRALWLIEKGIMADAEPLARQALQEAEGALGGDNPEIAPYLKAVSEILAFRGQTQQATDLRTRAVLLKHRKK